MFRQMSTLLFFIHNVFFPLYYVGMAFDICVQMVLLFVGVSCTGFKKIL